MTKEEKLVVIDSLAEQLKRVSSLLHYEHRGF